MNSSGLAIDRLVATLAENNYCSLHDIIHLPKILEPYFALFVGGKYKKWFSSCS